MSFRLRLERFVITFVITFVGGGAGGRGAGGGEQGGGEQGGAGKRKPTESGDFIKVSRMVRKKVERRR